MVFPSYSHPNMDVDNDAAVDVEPSPEPMRVMDVNLPRLAARSVANVYDPNKLKRAHRRGTPPSPRERCRSCLHTKGTLTLPSFQTFSCRKQGDDSEAHRFLFLLFLLCNIPIWLIINASDADVAAAPELCFCSHLGVSPKEYTLRRCCRSAVASRTQAPRPSLLGLHRAAIAGEEAGEEGPAASDARVWDRADGRAFMYCAATMVLRIRACWTAQTAASFLERRVPLLI